MATTVLIVGAGRLGRTFEHLLRRGKQSTVYLWDREPEKMPATVSLPGIGSKVDVVFFTVPTSAIRPATDHVLHHLQPSATAIYVSKGLEPTTKQSAAEIAEELLGATRPWIVLGGPMIAEELRAGSRGHGIIAGPGIAIRATLESILPPESMSFETTSRARDVSLAGVLKNLYAMAYGVGVGLGWSPLALTDLWRRCEAELVVASDRCGIAREIIIGPAGIGDFHATGGSPHSRNRNAGVQLTLSGEPDLHAEAIVSIPLLTERFPTLKELDIVRSMLAIMSHEPAKKVFSVLSNSHPLS